MNLHLRENRVHGEPMFPVSVYEVSEPSNGTLFDCHWHDEWEFMLIREGKVRVQLDMTEQIMTAGQAVFVGSGVLHGAFACDANTCSLTAVVVHPEFLASKSYDALQAKYLDPLLHKKFQVNPIISGQSQAEREMIHGLQTVIDVVQQRKNAYEMVSKANLYMIFSKLFSGRQSSEATSPNESMQIEKVKLALSYIHHHYHEPIRLKDLSDELGMSEAHFCRFFKRMTRRSPVSYLKEYRMQQAAKLLMETNHKVIEIAMQVGFDHLSYFISVFKSHYGMTPSQYRNRLHSSLGAKEQS